MTQHTTRRADGTYTLNTQRLRMSAPLATASAGRIQFGHSRRWARRYWYVLLLMVVVVAAIVVAITTGIARPARAELVNPPVCYIDPAPAPQPSDATLTCVAPEYRSWLPVIAKVQK